MKTTLILATMACFISQAYAEGFSYGKVKNDKSEWDSANHPKVILSKKYVSKLSDLPLEGEVSEDKTPWSDEYWARNKGGIAYRWQTKETPYRYDLIKRSEIKDLTEEQIKKLSPAEKFDLLRGDYRFPLTKNVTKKNDPSRPDWEGICNGWSLAAIHHPQAKPITLKNKYGLSIPFGASDVHALYSYFYAKKKIGGGSKLMGQRCRSNASTPSCEDVNAGAFHLVLTNLIGLKSKSFVVDVDQKAEVWNQPAHSYSSEIVDEREPSSDAAPGTVKEVRMRTYFSYVLEADSSWQGRKNPLKKRVLYTYWLELDANDQIIGGSWIGKLHPDFVWTGGKAFFWGKYTTLKKLL